MTDAMVMNDKVLVKSRSLIISLCTSSDCYRVTHAVLVSCVADMHIYPHDMSS